MFLALCLCLCAGSGWTQTTYTTAAGAFPARPGAAGTQSATCFPLTIMNSNIPMDGTTGLATICLNLTHAQGQDLIVYLTTPVGTFIPLFWSASGAMNGNFCFTDNTFALTLSGNTPATYLPEFPLGDANDGQTSTGVWELCVINSGTLAGTVNNFAVTLGGPNTAVPAILQGNNACIKEGCNYRYYDSGGPLYGYVNDEFVTETICPPVDGMCARITINSRDIEADGMGGCYDFLDVWDGPDFGAPNTLMTTLCGLSAVPVSFTSTTGCLTTVFLSDYIFTLTGWDATIDCVPCAAAVASTRPVNDDCIAAIPLDSSGTNTNGVGCDVDAPMPWVTDSCSWLSTENSVFYTVSVTATTPQPVEIQLTNVTCIGGANELQMALFDANCATIGTYGANYHGCAGGVDTVTLVANTPTLPTGDYILVVDGNAGSDCTWDVSSALLAVEYVEINGYYDEDENAVHLGWSTINEVNNAGFNIERSTDRHAWKNMGFVYPDHSIRSLREYSFTDHIQTREDKFYYRLKQIDHDGKSTYSNIVEVKLRDWEDIELISQYPNPVEDQLHLDIFAKKPGKATLTMVNTLGQTVHADEWEMGIGGEHKLETELSGVDEGLYHYYLKIGPETFGGKVIVKR